MQAEQNAAAHTGSVLQARAPDSVLRALKVSCTEGEKRQRQGSKGKIRVAKEGGRVCFQKSTSEKTMGAGDQEEGGEEDSVHG